MDSSTLAEDPSSFMTTLVVPCYNEEQRFPAEAFSAFISSHPFVRLLLVNDGSRDQTLAMLQQFQATLPERIDVLDLQPNRGKGEAVRLGLQQALSDGRSRFVGFWDADLATPLDALPEFVAAFADVPAVQMVFGARIALLGRFVQRDPLRHYLGRVFATCVSLVLHLPIYDSQCGAKVFRATPALASVLDKPFLSRWIFDVEIIARFIQVWNGDRELAKRVICELPLRVWTDVPGSKVKPSDFLRAFGDLVTIRSSYRL
jgi:dolichyl-phosphate beta-glucosyltransferase